jgi:hypothetical protein
MRRFASVGEAAITSDDEQINMIIVVSRGEKRTGPPKTHTEQNITKIQMMTKQQSMLSRTDISTV